MDQVRVEEETTRARTRTRILTNHVTRPLIACRFSAMKTVWDDNKHQISELQN